MTEPFGRTSDCRCLVGYIPASSFSKAAEVNVIVLGRACSISRASPSGRKLRQAGTSSRSANEEERGHDDAGLC